MSRHPRRRRSGTVLVVALTALAVSACDATPREPGPATTSSPGDPTAAPTGPDAAEVLAEYGVEPPAGAVDMVAQERDDDVMTDAYLVTFTAPADEVASMCADAGVNGPFPLPELLPEEGELFDVTELPEGARLCSGSSGVDLRRQIRVLFDGDPATVRVALYTMPER